jgi:hypothetical protein
MLRYILLIILGFKSILGFSQSDFDPYYYIKVLERKTELQADSIHVLEYKLSNVTLIMLKENVRKKAWIKVAIAEAAILGGAFIIISSGAVIPVIMAVGMIEVFLLLEGKYRLNIKQLKSIKRKPLKL